LHGARPLPATFLTNRLAFDAFAELSRSGFMAQFKRFPSR
jgi:hypothetical protein